MNRRLLILTAGFGEGHNAAARALAVAWNSRHGAGTACVADVFARANPRTNALARRGYLGLINRAPWIWKGIYGWLDRSRMFPRTLRLFRTERRVIAGLIAQYDPAVICSTYPVYAYWLAALARAGRLRVPCFTIVTDSISLNSLWWRAGSAGWFVPNEDSAEVMRRAGVEAARIHVLGFPVMPCFGERAHDLQPPPLEAGGTPRVLYIINSGTQAAADTARLLLTQTPWEITCPVGRNDALRRELRPLAAGRAARAEVLGWTDEMPRLLLSHHVVVSKAGGATTQEALAARCPLVVNQIVPGQEEGNYELLRRHGVGALAQTPEAVVRALQRAFAGNGAVWRGWRTALEPLARPHAARDIVLRIGELVAGAGADAIRQGARAPAAV